MARAASRTGSMPFGNAIAALFGIVVGLVICSDARAQCANYSVAPGPGTFVPGTVDVGLNDDDAISTITLPFPVSFFGVVYNHVNVDTNGYLHFDTAISDFESECLPAQGQDLGTTVGACVFAYWDDLDTTADGLGVFTNLSGSVGSRVFVIEWRAVFTGDAAPAELDFEVKFYENQAYFDVVYGHMSDQGNATVGAQASSVGPFVEYECHTDGPASGTSLRFGCVPISSDGACCNAAAGTCSFISSSACTGAGETFQGAGTSCPGPCSTKPSNDDCGANNPALSVGVPVTGTTIAATASAMLRAVSTPWCDPGNSPNPPFNNGLHLDVWYRFTPSVSGFYDINTCGSTFTTAIVINSGCPVSQSNLIDCNVSSSASVPCPDQGSQNASRIPNVALTAGHTYYIGVGGFNGDVGYFTLVVNLAHYGACCDINDGSCAYSASGSAGCGIDKMYQGDESVCSPALCQQGACCDNSDLHCVLTTQLGCSNLPYGPGGPVTGTFFGASSTCTSLPCAQLGACCSGSTGNCAISTQAGCPSGSTFEGTSVLCSAFVCGQGGCCNTATGQCTLSTQAGCASGLSFQGAGSTCAVFYCPIPSGVCCRGATCNASVPPSACTQSGSAGASFATSSGTCGPGSTTPCCYADFNKSGSITVQDIFDFLAAWFAHSPYAKVGSDGTAGPPTVQSIFDFLAAWFAKGC